MLLYFGLLRLCLTKGKKTKIIPGEKNNNNLEKNVYYR